MEKRDMSRGQFIVALTRYGIHMKPFGYADIGTGREVYRFNAGDSYREQLAYLIKRQDEIETEKDQSNESI